MIPALVLAAGLATRLRPLSHLRAKAALPVAGEALARRILRILAANGVRDAVLNLHHRPETITRLIGDGSDLGMRVRYSWESPVLGSAGGVRRALPLLEASKFLIVNGDTLTDLELRPVIEAHDRFDALVTMALVPNTSPDKYGGVLLDGDSVVIGFTRRGSAEQSFHFIGIQVATAEAFAGLRDDTPCESVGSLYPQLMHDHPGSVRGFVCDADFFDIGTPADYLDTCLLLAGREGNQSVLIGSRVRIDRSASITDCVLWDDVVVEAAARLRRCVVTDSVRIPTGAIYEEVTIRPAGGPGDPAETVVSHLAVAPLKR
jgi:NDP-sugar pyrophosphorylase family protein